MSIYEVRNGLNELKSNESLSENSVDALMAEFDSVIVEFTETVFDSLDVYSLISQGYMPELRVEKPTFNGDSFSFFIGNPKFGSYENGTGAWLFDSEFEFLSSLTVRYGQCSLNL